MKKKILIIILSILIILLIVILALNFNKKSDDLVYKCSQKTTSGTTLAIDYDIYYDKDNNIEKAIITKTYEAPSSSDRENLGTLKSIIEQENLGFSEYEGFSYKVLRDVASMYKYNYNIDVKKMPEETLNTFGIYKNLDDQKKYFDSKKEITCK